MSIGDDGGRPERRTNLVDLIRHAIEDTGRTSRLIAILLVVGLVVAVVGMPSVVGIVLDVIGLARK